jgi:putative addiction module killer protein
VFEVRQTAEFSRWLASLKDSVARAAVLTRLFRLSTGNPGDHKSVGRGVSELRIDVGPGYRVYYMRADRYVVLVLGGGDKSTQSRDIRRAIQLLTDLRAMPRKGT